MTNSKKCKKGQQMIKTARVETFLHKTNKSLNKSIIATGMSNDFKIAAETSLHSVPVPTQQTMQQC